jgi:hypothetical protein
VIIENGNYYYERYFQQNSENSKENRMILDDERCEKSLNISLVRKKSFIGDMVIYFKRLKLDNIEKIRANLIPEYEETQKRVYYRIPRRLGSNNDILMIYTNFKFNSEKIKYKEYVNNGEKFYLKI